MTTFENVRGIEFKSAVAIRVELDVTALLAYGASSVPIGENATCYLKDISADVMHRLRTASRQDPQKHLLDEIVDLILVTGLSAEILPQRRVIREDLDYRRGLSRVLEGYVGRSTRRQKILGAIPTAGDVLAPDVFGGAEGHHTCTCKATPLLAARCMPILRFFVYYALKLSVHEFCGHRRLVFTIRHHEPWIERTG